MLFSDTRLCNYSAELPRNAILGSSADFLQYGTRLFKSRVKEVSVESREWLEKKDNGRGKIVFYRKPGVLRSRTFMIAGRFRRGGDYVAF